VAGAHSFGDVTSFVVWWLLETDVDRGRRQAVLMVTMMEVFTVPL
jgi:hypothetical protein